MKKKNKLADSFYILAENIYRHLQSEDSLQWMPEFARVLTNRAINLRQMSKGNKPAELIEKLYLEALDLYQKANQNEGGNLYARHLGRVHNALANYYSMVKKYEQAEKAFQKALEIQSSLAQHNPIVFEIDLANTSYNYSLNLCKRNDTLNAKKYIWQA